jgi:hypothetical protein
LDFGCIFDVFLGVEVCSWLDFGLHLVVLGLLESLFLCLCGAFFRVGALCCVRLCVWFCRAFVRRFGVRLGAALCNAFFDAQKRFFKAVFWLFLRPVFTVFGRAAHNSFWQKNGLVTHIGYPNGYPRNLHNWGKILQKQGEIDVFCKITH